MMMELDDGDDDGDGDDDVDDGCDGRYLVSLDLLLIGPCWDGHCYRNHARRSSVSPPPLSQATSGEPSTGRQIDQQVFPWQRLVLPPAHYMLYTWFLSCE